MDIHVKGAREHNLRDLELRIPRGKLIVITGVSGSGKSSLAFDTIHAEGYRKYMESLSPKARQLLEQVKRPEVDFIHGLSPVVAIEQRGGGGSPRNTVATVTEIADYARLLWNLRGERFCPKDGGRVVKRTLDENVSRLLEEPGGSRLILLAHCLTARPAVLREELPRLRQRGFQRVRLDGEILSLDDPGIIPKGREERKVDIVIDRLVVDGECRSRLADSLELAFREGKNRAVALIQNGVGNPWREVTLSLNLACVRCGEPYEELTPRHFSFNHTDGACPRCGGLGREMRFAEELIVPDPGKTVRGGAVKPWRIGGKNLVIRHNALLKQLAAQVPFDPETPWGQLPSTIRKLILHGSGSRTFVFRFGRGGKKVEENSFAGVIPLLEKAKAETRSEGFRARLTTFQTSQTCSLCSGQRLHPISAGVLLEGVSLPGFFAMDAARAHGFLQSQALQSNITGGEEEVLNGLRERVGFLREAGLEYLTLDREYNTLSGGESQRVRLATQLGMGLSGICYVLDEPSIGLHPRDNEKLLEILRRLKGRDNTLLVVEHDADTMWAADHMIELGPGAGPDGGRIVFEGTPAACVKSSQSVTGPFLGGRLKIQAEGKPRIPDGRWLTVKGAAENNLQNIDVSFPVGLMTCVTGVSGSGKSSLVNDILARAAAFRLNRAKSIPGRHRGIEGWEHFERVVEVNQEPIGRSPRSNPATYVKLFDLLRDVFAQTPLARIRGYRPGRFSFNMRGGRCERCQGDGVIKLDMQFLADAHAECPGCHGRRYNRETLEVMFKGHSIADVLDLTIREAMKLFRNIPRAMEKLATLDAVGLEYLKLGQPAPTLSGGEAQRIKLSLELSKRQRGGTLYILDEPTTGLHWNDIQKLMDLLFALRDAGNTVIIIEHNLDLINLADWVIDLGPGGGDLGGRVVFRGPKEELPQCPDSLTGRALRERRKPRPG